MPGPALTGKVAEAMIGAGFPKPIGYSLGVVAKTLLVRAKVGGIYERPRDTGPSVVLDPAAMDLDRKGRTVFAQSPALVPDLLDLAFNSATHVLRHERVVIWMD